jgi:hypothetical protein
MASTSSGQQSTADGQDERDLAERLLNHNVSSVDGDADEEGERRAEKRGRMDIDEEPDLANASDIVAGQVCRYSRTCC